MCKDSEILLTPRQQRERDYFDEYSKLEPRPMEIDFGPVLGSEKRPWNSYWHAMGLVRDLFVSSSQKLLDFGCGDGRDAIRYAKLGYDVYAFDVSPSSIKTAQRLAQEHQVLENTHFSVQTAETLEYPSEVFDIVVGTNILHHCEVGPAIQEVRRVLKADGVGIFREHVEVPLLDRIRKSRLALTLVSRRKSFKHCITEDEHNLNFDEMRLIRQVFPQIRLYRFGLLARLRRLLPRLNRPLQKADYYLFRLLPFMRPFGSDVVMLVRK